MVDKIPVTVVIPVKNEEINLPKCLDCLQGFEKIVVVDSSSTDSTPDICVEYGVEYVNFEWNGRFPKKRNWYLRNFKIDTDWVFFVDADEYVTEKFKAELRNAVSNTNKVGFWLSYNNYFLGEILRFGETFTKLAVFKPNAGEFEKIDDEHWSKLDMEVHEHPILNGKIGKIKSPIKHNDFKGLNAYISRHNEYSSWEARKFVNATSQGKINSGKMYFRQRVKYLMINTWFLGPLFFIWIYFFKLGFLDGKPGFVFALNKMIYFLQIKMKIIEGLKQSN